MKFTIGMDARWRLFLSFFLLIFSESLQARYLLAWDMPDYYNEPGYTATRLYDFDTTGTEAIDTFSGTLRLVYKDLDIPGDGPNLTVYRTYFASGRRYANGIYGALEGRQNLGLFWSVHMGRVRNDNTQDMMKPGQPLAGYSDYCQLDPSVAPTSLFAPTFEHADGTRETLFIAAEDIRDAGWHMVTKSGWVGRCLKPAGTLEGFELRDPGGTTYTFSHHARIHSPDSTSAMWEKKAWHLTKIRDSYGNEITVTYHPNSFYMEIDEVSATDGRSVQFTYTDQGLESSELEKIDSSYGSWVYTYDPLTIPDPGLPTLSWAEEDRLDLGYRVLKEAKGPEGASWTYEYYTDDVDLVNGLSGIFAVKSVEDPYGVKTTYEYDGFSFYVQGDANASFDPIKSPFSSQDASWFDLTNRHDGTTTNYIWTPEILSVTRKEVVGASENPKVWLYEYRNKEEGSSRRQTIIDNPDGTTEILEYCGGIIDPARDSDGDGYIDEGIGYSDIDTCNSVTDYAWGSPGLLLSRQHDDFSEEYYYNYTLGTSITAQKERRVHRRYSVDVRRPKLSYMERNEAGSTYTTSYFYPYNIIDGVSDLALHGQPNQIRKKQAVNILDIRSFYTNPQLDSATDIVIFSREMDDAQPTESWLQDWKIDRVLEEKSGYNFGENSWTTRKDNRVYISSTGWLESEDINGKPYTYYHDGNGNLEKIVEPDGESEEFYNYSYGIPQRIERHPGVQNPDGSVSSISRDIIVDSYGDVESVTDEMGNTTIYEWDKLHRLTAILTARSDDNNIHIAYPSFTQRTLTRGDFSVDEVFYGNGQRKSVSWSQPFGGGETVSREFRYDENGNVEIETFAHDGLPLPDNLGPGIVSNFDGIGKILSQSIGGYTTNYNYGHAASSLDYTLIHNPRGFKTYVERYGRGKRGDGAVRQICEDVVYSTSCVGEARKTSQSVGSSGLVFSISQGVSQRIFSRRQSDPLELEFESHPDKETEHFSQDQQGNVDGSWLADNVASKVVKSYEHERLSSISYPADDSSPDREYFYNPDGSIHSIISENETVTYEYDENSNIKKKTLSIAGASAPYVILYSYDENDNVKDIAYPDGFVVSYFNDSFGRPRKIGTPADSEAFVVDVRYHPNGAVKRIEYANGVVTDIPLIANRQLVDKIQHADANGSPFYAKDYGYDENGNIKLIADLLDPADSLTMNYDSLDQLDSLSEASGSTFDFSYTANGNITRQGQSGWQLHYDGMVLENATMVIMDHPEMGKVIVDRVFGHDLEGNIISYTDSYKDEAGIAFSTSTLSLGFRRDRTLGAVQYNAGDAISYNYQADGLRYSRSSDFGQEIMVWDMDARPLYTESDDRVSWRKHVYLGSLAIAVIDGCVRSDPSIDEDLDNVPDCNEADYLLNPTQKDADSADFDGDGLSVAAELAIGTDPFASDTDMDGLSDGAELALASPTDPLLSDSDGDGLLDGVELHWGFDPSGTDNDDDGINDVVEYVNGLDPDSSNENMDSDEDELLDIAEIANGTDPHDPDTDGDGIIDGAEVVYGTDPLVADALQDHDGDGIITLVEHQKGYDPVDATSYPLLNDGDLMVVHEYGAGADGVPDGDTPPPLGGGGSGGNTDPFGFPIGGSSGAAGTGIDNSLFLSDKGVPQAWHIADIPAGVTLRCGDICELGFADGTTQDVDVTAQLQSVLVNPASFYLFAPAKVDSDGGFILIARSSPAGNSAVVAIDALGAVKWAVETGEDVRIGTSSASDKHLLIYTSSFEVRDSDGLLVDSIPTAPIDALAVTHIESAHLLANGDIAWQADHDSGSARVGLLRADTGLVQGVHDLNHLVPGLRVDGQDNIHAVSFNLAYSIGCNEFQARRSSALTWHRFDDQMTPLDSRALTKPMPARNISDPYNKCGDDWSPGSGVNTKILALDELNERHNGWWPTSFALTAGGDIRMGFVETLYTPHVIAGHDGSQTYGTETDARYPHMDLIVRSWVAAYGSDAQAQWASQTPVYSALDRLWVDDQGDIAFSAMAAEDFFWFWASDGDAAGSYTNSYYPSDSMLLLSSSPQHGNFLAGYESVPPVHPAMGEAFVAVKDSSQKAVLGLPAGLFDGSRRNAPLAEPVAEMPEINSFASDFEVIPEGGDVVLSWATTNADIVTLQPGDVVVTANGTLTVSPAVTTEYILEAQSGTDMVSASLTVEVRNAADIDTDGDGIPDGIELGLGLDPDDPADAAGDLDQDGFTNAEEWAAGSDLDNALETADSVAQLLFTGTQAAGDWRIGPLAESPDGRFVYLQRAAYIDVYRRNPLDGSLALASSIGGLDTDIEWLVMSGDGEYLYATSSNDDRFWVMRRDALTGGLTLIQTFDAQSISRFNGTGKPAASADGRFVYVPSLGNTGGMVHIFRRTDAGVLIYAGGDDFINRSLGNQIESVVIGGDANELLIALTNTGTHVLERDSVSGAIGTLLASGGTNRNGMLLYQQDLKRILTGTYYVYDYAWDDTVAAEQIVYNDKLHSAVKRIALSADQSLLYAMRNTGDYIYIDRVNDPAGLSALHQMRHGQPDPLGSTVTMDNPKDLLVTADGRHVYVSAASSQAISIFRHDRFHDLDGDLIPDSLDADWDGDDVDNAQDSFPADATEWADSDGDGYGDNIDAFETDPAYFRDTDDDGTADALETDRDNDLIPDAWELQYGLDPLNPADADMDPDGDGVINYDEWDAGTDPLAA
ncbi:MAG: hypothetical protein P1U64_07885 [Alcanivoracaceae bacterium]|nr:hypothetical protein [Alcanivoracaceae bacterium]